MPCVSWRRNRKCGSRRWLLNEIAGPFPSGPAPRFRPLPPVRLLFWDMTGQPAEPLSLFPIPVPGPTITWSVSGKKRNASFPFLQLLLNMHRNCGRNKKGQCAGGGKGQPDTGPPAAPITDTTGRKQPSCPSSTRHSAVFSYRAPEPRLTEPAVYFQKTDWHL